MNIYKTMGAVFGASIVLLLLSGIPALKDAKDGWQLVVGEIVWIGFLAGMLALIVLAATALVRASRRRRAVA